MKDDGPVVRDENLPSESMEMLDLLRAGRASEKILEEKFGDGYFSVLRTLFNYAFVKGSPAEDSEEDSYWEVVPEYRRCRIRVIDPIVAEYWDAGGRIVADTGTVWNAWRIEHGDLKSISGGSPGQFYAIISNRNGSDYFYLTEGKDVEVVPFSVRLTYPFLNNST